MRPALRLCPAETAAGCDCSNQGCRHSIVMFLTLVPSLAFDQRALFTRAQLSGSHMKFSAVKPTRLCEVWGPKQHSFLKALGKRYSYKRIRIHIMYTANCTKQNTSCPVQPFLAPISAPFS